MVLKNDGSQSPFMPDDFAVGCDISIYGRVVRIYDCDEYTRAFFENQGRPQPAGQTPPKDNFATGQVKPVQKRDNEMKEFLEKSLGGGKVASQKQFLDNDRRVLRFFTLAD